jgi:transcriptional regulator with XRE-family HTH domain
MIGNNIRAIRISKKIGLNQLARMAKVSPGYLSELENNKFNNPTMDKLNKIADALDVSVDEFFKEALYFEPDSTNVADKVAEQSSEYKDAQISSMIEKGLKEAGLYREDMTDEEKLDLANRIVDILKLMGKK